MIVKTRQGYFVRSHSGKNLGGPYRSYDDAHTRLAQVEMFKSIDAHGRRIKPKRMPRKNPLGPGFGFGLLTGGILLAGAWGLYYATREDAKGKGPDGASTNALPSNPTSDCYLCLQPDKTLVPTKATQVELSAYRNYAVASYYINADFGYGAAVQFPHYADSTYNWRTRAEALADLRKKIDADIASGNV